MLVKLVRRVMTWIIDSSELLMDLHKAYLDARKNKRGKVYQLEFEYRLEDNLVELRDELISGNYKPRPSTCFVIYEPKMREVFAASFRDRVVHHLFYNYVHVLFERTFIYDSYSCIKGRGTHFGIKRLQHHIRSESAGYSRPCYVLKIDIRGYFMGIDRARLLEICRRTMEKMQDKPSDDEGVTWGEKLDYPFVDNLLESIVNNDPTKGCIMLGNASDWAGLPSEKSLFHAAPGCGLPIGNLSSQLFSNVYMNEFDQFAKRELGCKHYGRYVDDAFVVSTDREWLKSLVPRIEAFLKERLGLSLNRNKLCIRDVRHGVEFLGAYVLPFRTYVSSSSLRRIKCHLLAMPPSPLQEHSPREVRLLQSRVNSWLGVLSHYASHCLRRVLFGHLADLPGSFSRDWLRFRSDSAKTKECF